MTTYPISKIRSGEVAVRLTDIEQFKKIAPEQEDVIEQGYFLKNKYHIFLDKDNFTWLPDHYKSPLLIKIDFQQIDWEEGKEETVKEFKEPILHEAGDYRVLVNGFPLKVPFRIIAEDNYQILQTELSTLKAENERLANENEELVNDVIKLSKGNEKLLGKIAMLEQNYDILNESQLSLEQRLAWQLYTELDNTLEDSFKKANNFLNYKGGDDEK